MVTCQSSELGWEVTVELPTDFLSLGKGSVKVSSVTTSAEIIKTTDVMLRHQLSVVTSGQCHNTRKAVSRHQS